MLDVLPTDFIQTKKYPAYTPVHRIVEGAESAPFKQYFATWRDAGMQHTRLIRAINEDSDSGLGEEVDEETLRALTKSGGRALGFMPDDGTGQVQIWKIDGGLQKLDESEHGVFYGSKCYIVRYQFSDNTGSQKYILYYWQVS